MTESHSIALSILIASILLTLQVPIRMRSWVQSKTLHRSQGMIVILYFGTTLGTIQKLLAIDWIEPFLSFLLLMAASWQFLAIKQQDSPVWASARILPITRGIALSVGGLLAFGGYTSSEFYVALTVLAGIFHVLTIRAENAKIIELFTELTRRIATLQALQFSIQPKTTAWDRESRDIKPKAG